jgi:type I restriction enzyme S subunit
VKEFRLATPRSAYFLLESLQLDAHRGGAAVPTLNRNHIHGLPIVMPPRQLVADFDEAVAPMFRWIETLSETNRVLHRLGDLLLARLVNGRLDISRIDLGDLLPAETA